MEASRTFNPVRQMQCTSEVCGSDGMFRLDARCPDCGCPMAPIPGSCDDCGQETEMPGDNTCLDCARWYAAQDRRNDRMDDRE